MNRRLCSIRLAVSSTREWIGEDFAHWSRLWLGGECACVCTIGEDLCSPRKALPSVIGVTLCLPDPVLYPGRTGAAGDGVGRGVRLTAVFEGEARGTRLAFEAACLGCFDFEADPAAAGHGPGFTA